MKSLGFSDLETLDGQIEGLKGLLELLYQHTMNDESLTFITSVIYALQTYAEGMDATLQNYLASQRGGARHE